MSWSHALLWLTLHLSVVLCYVLPCLPARAERPSGVDVRVAKTQKALAKKNDKDRLSSFLASRPTLDQLVKTKPIMEGACWRLGLAHSRSRSRCADLTCVAFPLSVQTR